MNQTAPDTLNASSFSWHRLAIRLLLWLETQIPILLHVIRLLMAMMLAMSVSMLFNLSKPGTAMVTTVIVMQPRSGVVTSKAFYRFIGTFIGSIVSVIIASAFNQNGWLFLAFGSLWIGFCTAGSLLFRNFQSYGFVLAGYTLMIVGLPGALAPDSLFDAATLRIAEVLVGILCSTFVSEIVFPSRLSELMTQSARSQFQALAKSMQRQRPEEYLDQAQSRLPQRENMVLNLLGQVISFETMRSSAVFEKATGQSHDTLMRRFTGAFALLSTTFHALDQLFARLSRFDDKVPAQQLLDEYSQILALQSQPGNPADSLAARGAILPDRLKHLRYLLFGDSQDAVSNDSVQHSQQLLEFDATLPLLERFCRELKLLSQIEHALVSGTFVDETQFARAVPLNRKILARTDTTSVVTGTLRAMLCFIVSYVFWYFSGYPSGADMVLMATVICALFAGSAIPTAGTIQFVAGGAIGSLAGVLFAGFVLPNVENLPMLIIGFSPFVAVLAWISMIPRFAGLGLGATVFLATYSGISDAYNADLVALVNGSSGGLLGGVLAGLFFLILDPAQSEWSKNRVARALRRRVVLACREPLPDALTSLNASVRDLMGRFVAPGAAALTQPASSDRQDGNSYGNKRLLLWLLSTMEIGRAVIHLREEQQYFTVQSDRQLMMNAVNAISRLFSRANAARLQETLLAIDQAIQHFRYAPVVMTHLHLIRITLTERVSILHPSDTATTLPESRD